MRKIEAVIFDWAGTTVDYGCFAPVQAFQEAFAHHGVPVTLEETRKPMGMLKRDHIRTMLRMERIARAVGLLPGPGDALHPEHGADVVPLQHTHGLTGLLQGDRHAVVGEGLLKGLDGGKAAVVHSGARPVKDDGLDHAISSLWAARKPAMMEASFSISSG